MVSRLMPYRVLTYGLSDIGLVRQNNEDVWAQVPELGFFILADGMGGHQAGEVAAREAVNYFCTIIKKTLSETKAEESTLEVLKDLVRRAIVHVNAHVFKMGRADLELRGMGTTLCSLLFHQTGLVFAHVGDSRIYRFRKDELLQLTKDHSLLRDLVDQGQINEFQADDFLYKNIITKAIGTEPRVDPTVETCEVQPNDLYLMCSDGLSDLLTSEEIEDIIATAPSLREASEALIASANEKGGRDNITVVISKIEGIDEPKDISR